MVNISLEVDKVYWVLAEYGNSERNTSIMLDSRVITDEFYLTVFIYENNHSIAFIHIFTHEPEIYGQEIDVTFWITNEEYKYYPFNQLINVKFFKFYKNGSILLEKRVINATESTKSALNRGYYLTIIQSNGSSLIKIIQIGGYASTLHIIINSATKKIIDLKVYWMFTDEKPPGIFGDLLSKTILLLAITIPLVVLVVYKKRIKMTEIISLNYYFFPSF